MLSGTTSPTEWAIDRLDVLAAVVGLLVAVALLPIRLLTSQVLITTIPPVLGLACAIYLVSRRVDGGEGPPTFSSTTAAVLPSIVFLSLAGLVALGVAQGQRTPLFYYLAIGVGALLFLQIVFVHDDDFHPAVVLGQVVAFAFVVRFVALVTTPGFVGIDIWTHTELSRSILESGSLAPLADNKYYASPLFHLLAASAAAMFDLPIRAALYLTLGVAMPLSILFVYAGARHLVDHRWAAFATATFGVAGSVVEWGIHLIPTSLGLLFFVGLLYGLVRILHVEYAARDFALVVFFSVGIILTHQVSTFIMLVFVAGGLVAQFLSRAVQHTIDDLPDFDLRRFRRQETVNMVGLFTFDVGLITYMWSTTPYKGSTFLQTLVNYLQTALLDAGFLAGVGGSSAGSGGGSGGAPALLATVVTYVDAAQQLLLLFVTVVGSLYVLRRENISHAKLTLVVATVGMLVFTFVPSMFGVDTFLPGRWWAFLAAPMAIVGGVGMGYLTRQLGPSSAVLLLFVFVAAFPAVALVSSDATIDNPAFGTHQTRYSYSQAELAAVDDVDALAGASHDRDVYTDHPYQTLIERTHAAPAEPAVVANGTADEYDLVVHREYQTAGGAFFLNDRETAHKPSITTDDLCGDGEHLYDNGEVTVCHATGGTA